MRKQVTVWVRNNGDQPLSDKYDGEEFTIAPGGAIEMEADCARLVFGFGERDKTRAIRRLGWAASSQDMQDALRRLQSFAFYSTREELELADRDDADAGARQASSTAPASGDGAAGGATAPPVASGHGVGERVARRENRDRDVTVRDAERDAKGGPVNALSNIARAATASAG